MVLEVQGQDAKDSSDLSSQCGGCSLSLLPQRLCATSATCSAPGNLFIAWGLVCLEAHFLVESLDLPHACI